MEQRRIAAKEWDGRLRRGMVDFFNYLLSGGFRNDVMEEGKEAASLAQELLDAEAAARYRQERLGGFLTECSQLILLPGATEDGLERIAFRVNGMRLENLSLLAPHTTQGNRAEAFVNGPDSLAVILEEIGRAERYIHFSVMLFFNDKSGNRVAAALEAALKRGVQVRLMVDATLSAIGYDHNLEYGRFELLKERLEAAGAQVVNTFESCCPKEAWPAKRKELAEKGVPDSSLYVHDFAQAQAETGLNIINHRKFIVLDGHTLILGSLNVGDQYLGDTPILAEGNVIAGGRRMGIPGSPKEWHDGCFRIRGEAAYSANRIFAAQWGVATGESFDPGDEFHCPSSANRRYGDEECTLVASFAGNPVNLIQSYHLALLEHAADETVIVNPYLIDGEFWKTLQSLEADRAAHISICNPLHINDHPTNLAAVRGHMRSPFEKGVSFYDYSGTERFSHWKVAYDRRADAVFHGSYNLNERSACHDFELGILVRGEAFADTVREMIGYDLGVSRQIEDAGEFFKHPALHPSTYLNKLISKFA